MSIASDDERQPGGRDDPASEPATSDPASYDPSTANAVESGPSGNGPTESGPAGSQPAPLRSSGSIPPDVANLLTSVAKAIQTFSMYPPNHPALEPAANTALEPLQQLLAERAVINIGVASGQLAIADAATDPGHERFSSLAGRLHRHQLASLSFERGIELTEFTELLASLAVEPELSEHPLGQVPDDEHPEWNHIRLEPIRYEHLGMARQGQEPAGDGEASGPPPLWLGLARAAMVGVMSGELQNVPGARLAAVAAGQEISAGADEMEEMEALARAIEERSSDDEYAEGILKQLVELSRELRATGEIGTPESVPTEELRRRTSLLISMIDPEALSEILRRGGDSRERVQLVLDSSRSMDPGAAVLLFRAAALAEGQDLSHWLVLMLSKLAAHASSGADAGRQEAHVNLSTQMELMVADWDLQDPVHPDQAQALARISAREAEARQSGGRKAGIESDRVLMTGIEVDRMGDAVSAAVDEMLSDGELPALISLLSRAPDSNAPAIEIWERIETPDSVRQLLDDPSPDLEVLDLLVARMGIKAAEPLLDLLAATESLRTRRELFARLASMGPELGPAVVRRLRDERWFVKRNMLALMGELPEWPRQWTPSDQSEHPHPAVRREALKLMLREERSRDLAVCALLKEDDSRALSLGLAAALEDTPPEAVPLLVPIAQDESLTKDLRVSAVRALGTGQGTVAREALLSLASSRRGWLARLFGRRRVAQKSPVVLEALNALAGSADPRAERLLSRAARSSDPVIRRAAEGRLTS